MAKKKAPKHGVVDLSGPTMVRFTDSIKYAKAAAEANENYVAVSLATHPKKSK